MRLASMGMTMEALLALAGTHPACVGDLLPVETSYATGRSGMCTSHPGERGQLPGDGAVEQLARAPDPRSAARPGQRLKPLLLLGGDLAVLALQLGKEGRARGIAVDVAAGDNQVRPALRRSPSFVPAGPDQAELS